MLLQSERSVVLRVTQIAWETMLNQLLRDPACRFAHGDVLGQASSHATVLCAGTLTVTRDRPTGSSRGALAPWVVVMLVDQPGKLPSAGLVRRQLQPLHAQQLTVVCVDNRSPSAGWVGWVMERGDIRPLDGLQIMGAPPIVSYREPVARQIEEDTSDAGRYSRLRPVLGDAYAATRRSTVLLVGASRSGSQASMQLAALGVRRLIMADPDLVEQHNLDGMFWATPDDVGRSKAVVNAERISQFRPDMSIQPLTTSIRDPDVRLPALCDLVITCVDDEVARRHSAALASRWLLPHLDVATQVLDTSSTGGASRALRADVRFVLPGEGCMACIGGATSHDVEDHERFAPPESLTASQLRPWNQQRLGSLITLNAIAVSIGLQTWLQFLSGDLSGSIWHRISWDEPTNLRVESGQVRGRGECCGSVSPSK